MRLRAWLVSFVAVSVLGVAAGSATAAVPPGQDPFYSYSGTTPLSQIAPGTVLKSRTTSMHIVGIPTAITAVQLLYRSTGQRGQATVNVTSILKPLLQIGTARVVSYQSFYDSLNQDDEPSYQVTGGGLSIGGAIPQLESGLVQPLLLAGYTIAVPDTEGQAADFAAGPEYGYNTLDGLRAAVNARSQTGVSSSSKIGMIGYSGGAIATEWAAELAPSYAPDVDRNLIGSAMGGVLVDPAHNLHYVDGTPIWAGVMPMAIVGVARAFNINLTPYLSAKGTEVYNAMQKTSITNVLGQYPGLTWAQMAKPQYATPESVPEYVHAANQLIMGTAPGSPNHPLFIGQGANGILEGTPGDKPGIGAGDGVMIAGDVRTLARQYCAAGVKVQYDQYDLTSHVTSAIPWLGEAVPWLTARFAGLPAPKNCSSIAAGNALTPIPES
ncbi:MAG TPA: lipase family protein [Baekduia sp.]|uniref:lipase family protein n=1 Tax=Baekduia sp. TaxID=2600305 RepID=UPI002D773825|nr:lipase family protein [Baekduia sp.]HET6509851.1 lipase family protein [Baekduia sp.]